MASLPPPPPPPPQWPPPPSSGGDDNIRVHSNEYDVGRQRWGLGDVAILVVGFFSLGIVLTVAANGGFDDLENLVLEDFWLPLILAGPPLVQLLYLTWISHSRGLGFDADFQFRFRPYDLLAGLGLWLSAMILATVVVLAIDLLGGEPPSAAAAEVAQESGDESGLTFWIILFAVLGATLIPVVEELIFRGLLWSALEKRGVNNIVSLFITTVVFAAIHLEPTRFVILCAIGLAFGVGRLATGRIGASIIAHALVNAIGMIAVVADIA
ncbi:MAG: type II CAAX endopeptidase family protein [Actinomycetota bacterium]